MEGVTEVKTSIPDHTLTVTFDSGRLDLERITRALNDVGYTVGEAELPSRD
ncbi:MAG: heavy-metal-associated domain-containing protein [bacterium]|nr:MAG: heavy-metal-associated domain-containing protein [bacterium]